MKLLLKISSEKNLLKAMGSEVKTGKYYNNAGKVAMRIHKKNTYHFDYSKGKKQGYAKHSDYSRMTHGLKHESEFQKQTKGKIKGKAGLHAEKHRTKKGHTTTKWVKNAKPGVKGTKQRAGSKVNDVKPKPKQTGKQEPVAVARPKSSGGSAPHLEQKPKASGGSAAHLTQPPKPRGKTGESLGTNDALSKKITELASQVEPKVRPSHRPQGKSTTHYDHGPNAGKPLPKHMTDKMKKKKTLTDNNLSPIPWSSDEDDRFGMNGVFFGKDIGLSSPDRSVRGRFDGYDVLILRGVSKQQENKISKMKEVRVGRNDGDIYITFDRNASHVDRVKAFKPIAKLLNLKTEYIG